MCMRVCKKLHTHGFSGLSGCVLVFVGWNVTPDSLMKSSSLTGLRSRMMIKGVSPSVSQCWQRCLTSRQWRIDFSDRNTERHSHSLMNSVPFFKINFKWTKHGLMLNTTICFANYFWSIYIFLSVYPASDRGREKNGKMRPKSEGFELYNSSVQNGSPESPQAGWDSYPEPKKMSGEDRLLKNRADHRSSPNVASKFRC